jgi:hypothetical protein
VAKTKKAQTIEKERVQFKQLILQNPNYFGSIRDSPFKSVLSMLNNTKYEELACVGLNIDHNMLEATVQIKLPYGYGGDLCHTGTTEYVRFYMDYGDGWEDVGIAAFKAHDIPNTTDCTGAKILPLSYTVTLPITPKKKGCDHPVLPKVRAILSWEAYPPENDPDWDPPWGNKLTRYVQVKPLVLIVPFQPGLTVVEPIESPFPFPEFEGLPPLPQPPPMPPPLKLIELMKLYGHEQVSKETRDKSEALVEPHRFGFVEMQSVMAAGVFNPQAVQNKTLEWKSLGLDWPAAMALLEQTSGNVSYEELICLGLDYNREWLVATFQVKKPSGYSGDLCHNGSLEYISFWADWDDQCEWQHLDTVSVRVHDILEIPEDGLYYSVLLRVNLDQYRQSCEQPKIARVRAVLSWNQAPSDDDPNKIPYWGNRKDVHVQIKHGPSGPAPTGPNIGILGGIGVDEIGTDGMTKPGALFSVTGFPADKWNPSRSCPFGGKVVVHGPPILGSMYRVWVQKVGSPDATRLTEPIRTTDQYGVGTWRYPNTDGFFTYLPDSLNLVDLLAWWNTTEDGLWEIWLETFTMIVPPPGSPYPPIPVFLTSQRHQILVDNTKPVAEITIDGGDCELYTPGTVLTGKFAANDLHFGHFELYTTPSSMSPPDPKTGTPTVSVGTYQTAPSPGDKWTLDTKGMKPCGYVVRVSVWDRSIVNSEFEKHNFNDDDKGFCLLEKP